MRTALARHDHLIEQAVAQHAGQVVRPRGEGDSRFCVFARATDAVAAAAAIQHALRTEPWPTPARLKVRIALHTGEADLRDGDYYGSAVNRCARLRAIAHGGQTLLSQATADLARAGPHDGLGLRDMGEQRLSDLIAPEHVFQLRHPTLQDDFPPLRSLAAAPNNLPLQLTSFVGREADVAEVRALIAAHRLVTLTGTGGTGKTRLALQAAAELLDAYPDGVWFIDLAPLTDAALVPGAALAAIGAHEQPGRSAVETLIDLLGSKTRAAGAGQLRAPPRREHLAGRLPRPPVRWRARARNQSRGPWIRRRGDLARALARHAWRRSWCVRRAAALRCDPTVPRARAARATRVRADGRERSRGGAGVHAPRRDPTCDRASRCACRRLER